MIPVQLTVGTKKLGDELDFWGMLAALYYQKAQEEQSTDVRYGSSRGDEVLLDQGW